MGGTGSGKPNMLCIVHVPKMAEELFCVFSSFDLRLAKRWFQSNANWHKSGTCTSDLGLRSLIIIPVKIDRAKLSMSICF